MITNIFGEKGNGKTTLLRKLIRERTKSALVCSFDKDLLPDFPPRHRFTSAYALLDRIMEDGGISINYPLCLSIMSDNRERNDREFELFCRIAIEHQKLMVVIDEVDMFSAANSKTDRLYRLIHYQRHEFGGFCDLVTASRKPSNVSRDLRGQTDMFYLFYLSDACDLDYVRDNIRRDLPDQLRNLPPFHFLKYDKRRRTVTPGVVRP